MPLEGVQKPARQHRVGANRVKAVRCHLGEVLIDTFLIILAAILSEAERPASSAANRRMVVRTLSRRRKINLPRTRGRASVVSEVAIGESLCIVTSWEPSLRPSTLRYGLTGFIPLQL